MIKGGFAAQKESKNLPGVKSVDPYGGAPYALELVSAKDALALNAPMFSVPLAVFLSFRHQKVLLTSKTLPIFGVRESLLP